MSTNVRLVPAGIVNDWSFAVGGSGHGTCSTTVALASWPYRSDTVYRKVSGSPSRLQNSGFGVYSTLSVLLTCSTSPYSGGSKSRLAGRLHVALSGNTLACCGGTVTSWSSAVGGLGQTMSKLRTVSCDDWP